MQFTFSCKRKQGQRKPTNCQPFPAHDTYRGVFNGLSVEVAHPLLSRSLYESGCYGKGSRSRGAPESEDETLLLGLEEACFLAFYLKRLQIESQAGEPLDWQAFVQASRELDGRFVEHLACYLYLKSKNWVIKSGIKFGGDFLIYKQSPRLFHASFLVLVQTEEDADYYQPKNLKGVQRVAETSDKDVLVLRVRAEAANQAEDLQGARVTETIVRRFNYSTFVQSKQQ
ncbi:hypothetical protein KR018_005278 [Drosophila ironensis]|nr:hypothetical protein KR018_005278 [Drosophila ironensis]